MAAVSSRPYSHAPPHKTLPITMPSKAPAYHYPVSRVAMSPPEASDSSTYDSRSGRSYSARSRDCRSDDYDSYGSGRDGVDVVDMLSERMERAFDPIRMDRSLAKQAQSSGSLNAKQRELAELQAMAQRRVKSSRKKYDEGMEAARETRRDLDYSSKKLASMKEKASRNHPDAYAKARSKYDY